MSFFSFLHFFNSIVYLYLAVYIFIKNPKALMNRILALSVSGFALWSFGSMFVENLNTSEHTARLFEDISSFAWISFSSFFLWFMLAFAGKKEMLKKKSLYLFLFGLPIIFIYLQWAGFLIVDHSKEYFGWKAIFSKSIWPYLYFLYYFSFMAAALYVNIDFMRTTREVFLKKQAKIIFITVVISLSLSSLTDIILPLSGIQSIPSMADTFTLVWVVGVVYAMGKYKFLTITPGTAADDIISTMFDSLILLNWEGEIEYVNQAALDLSGYKEEELKGKSIEILLPIQDLKAGVVEKITRESSLKNRDFVFKTKKGDNVPVLFSSSHLDAGAGTTGGIVCVVRDIPGRKKLEEEVLKSKKLEALGILAGGIAHDFNNLLSAIIGNISLVQNILGAGEKKQELLKKAEDASLKAANLASKFVTFSPGGWLYIKEITLATILKNVSASGLPGKNIDYDMEIPARLASIYADEEQLTQVVENLLLNAADSMPGGGKISLRAENKTLKAETDLPLKEGEYVKVLIRDNGGGIPPENIEKIFDPYFSTKERMSRKRMGLGLTVCYSIMKKHGGHIAIESKEGQGTTAVLYVPAYH
jgi:PAS domain S-box-containing protein